MQNTCSMHPVRDVHRLFRYQCRRTRAWSLSGNVPDACGLSRTSAQIIGLPVRSDASRHCTASYRLPLFARPFWVGTRACAADADTRSAPQRADTLPMYSPRSGSSGRIHAKRHSPEKLMNDLTRKARGTPQQHRKYAQDTATDDGMSIAPEKPRLTNPNAREQPRTAEQKRSDASPRPGTACRSTR